MATVNADSSLRDKVAAHFSEAFRQIGKAAGSEAYAEGQGWHRIHTRLPHFLANVGIVESGADLKALQAAVEPLVSPTISSSLLFQSSDVSDQAIALLAGNGFYRLGAMPLMTIDIRRLPDTKLVEGFDLIRVGTPDAKAWGQALADGYGLPAEVGAMCAALIGRKGIEAYAAVQNDRIVSTSMAYLHDGLAGIYWVATIREARGRGIGRHMTAFPLRVASEKGYAVGVLQSTEMGYSVYRNLGFEEVGAVPLFARLIGPAQGPS